MRIFVRIITLYYIWCNFYTNAGKVQKDPNILWCSYCGASVGPASYLFNKISPGNLKAELKTVFGHNVTVQKLINPFMFKFNVITTKKADCRDLGKNSRGDSWFPGYSWRICTCPSCASQLGWTFERTISNDVMDANLNETFHALILDRLHDVFAKDSPKIGTTTP